MFNSLKSFLKKEKDSGETHNQQAKIIADEIALLEVKLAASPENSEWQKALMLAYNRALPLFAKSQQYRQQVDDLFLRIDRLRNIIRRNI